MTASGAPEQEAVDAAADVAEIRFVAGLEFDSGAACVTDFRERLAHRGPVHVAITKIHPGVAAFLALEIFEMRLDDALAELANPVLRVAVKHDVAHVKPCLDPRALEFINVLGHFERTEKELVSDFFDGNNDFQLFRNLDNFAYIY